MIFGEEKLNSYGIKVNFHRHTPVASAETLSNGF